MSHILDILGSLSPKQGEDDKGRLIRCAHLFTDALDGGLTEKLLNEFSTDRLSENEITSDEYKEILTNGKFLVLGQDEFSQIALIRQNKLSSRIHTSPAAYIEKTISAGAIDFTLLSLPDNFNEKVFDGGIKLDVIEDKNGVEKPLIVKDVNQTIDYHRIQVLPRIAIRLAFNPVGVYEWGFDRDTLLAQDMTSLSFNDSGIAGVLELLTAMGNQDTAGILEQLMGHQEHFVRWKAIQALAKIDRERGISSVKSAVNDQHPEIRSAARKVLSALS